MTVEINDSSENNSATDHLRMMFIFCLCTQIQLFLFCFFN